MLATALSQPGAQAPGLRHFPIVGDAYEPALRGGDVLIVAPCDRFEYDTDYLLDFGDGEAPYVASRAGGGQVSVRHRNPRYTVGVISRESFDRAVSGIVVAEVRIRDRARAVHAHRVAA